MRASVVGAVVVVLAGLTGCGGAEPAPAAGPSLSSVDAALAQDLAGIGLQFPDVRKYREEVQQIVCYSSDEVLTLMVAMNRDKDMVNNSRAMRLVAERYCPDKARVVSAAIAKG